jgi:hypothetical protein
MRAQIAARWPAWALGCEAAPCATASLISHAPAHSTCSDSIRLDERQRALHQRETAWGRGGCGGAKKAAARGAGAAWWGGGGGREDGESKKMGRRRVPWPPVRA